MPARQQPPRHTGRVQRIVHLVRTFSQPHRALVRAWRPLCWDLLALLAGLKPAIMLDYCFNLRPATLQQLLAQLQEAIAPGGPLAGLTAPGHYLCHPSV